VSERSGAPNILIIDDDVGFLWWLGELFNEIGYRSIPALNCKEALALVRHLRGGVDLVLVNPSLKGVAALVRILSRVQRPKIVLIYDSVPKAIPPVEAAATLERPAGWGPISRPEWRQKVSRVLNQVGIRAAS
jgi:DNA-binding NtrC family response regulator